MSIITNACLLLMYFTNTGFEDKSAWEAFFLMIAPFIVWFFGIWAKKKELKGKMTFKQGLIEGLKISLVYAIISPFVFMFHYLFINPSLVQYAKEVYKMTNSPDLVVIVVDMIAQFFGAIIFGTIYAAIISFFLKTKN